MDRWDKLTYVGCEKDSHGIMQGNMILREANQGDMNGDGTVSCLILSGPEDDRDAQLQAAGCVQALEKAGLSVSLLETRWGQWTAESGRKSCADALAQYGKDIEVIFCGDDRIALGAAEAIRSGGWTVGKDYLLIGLGGIEQAIEAVNMGNMTGTVAEDLTGQAKQVLAVARAILAGETLEKKYYVSCMKVTAENAQAYLPE